MRQGLSKTGVILLVLAIVVVGLGACARSAREREASEATPIATAVEGGATPGEGSPPAPGETVVSAVTPIAETPGVEVQPTPEGQGTPVVPPPPSPTTAPEPTAAPTQAPPPPSQGGTIWHTVQRGETLNSIARRYGTTWQAIANANGLVNPNQIYVGQKLKIPTSGGSSSGPSGGTQGCRIRHTVKQGEWVWQIARNYGVSPYDILAANGLTIAQANTIYAGTVLCIP